MRSWWEGAYFGSSWKRLREAATKRFRFHSGQCGGWLLVKLSEGLGDAAERG